ncbi:MAG: hypothetical protein ACM31P_04550 [Actinomycetota bacterium]
MSAKNLRLLRRDDSDFLAHLAALWRQQGWRPHSHTEIALAYYAQRPADLGCTAEDVSYIVLHDGVPVLAFLGALLKDGDRVHLKAFELPALCLSINGSIDAGIHDAFLKEFSRLLEQVDGEVLVRDFLAGGALGPLGWLLLRRGATLTANTLQLLDLAQDEAVLWRELRKSYKSLINWGQRELTLEYMDSGNADWERMDLFRQLHIQVAGRETRTKQSWQKQFKWVEEGTAFVIFGWWKGELVTVGMYTYTDQVCTYFSSASRRDYFDKPLFHCMLWQGIVRAKTLGCRWFDVNEKYFPNHPVVRNPDKKLMAISDFKAGFGGELRLQTDLSLNLTRTRSTE